MREGARESKILTKIKLSYIFLRFPNYGNDMPYTPNYTFPNLAATSGASDWADYSGVDSTTSTPFEARQTPETITNLTGNGGNTLENTLTGGK